MKKLLLLTFVIPGMAWIAGCSNKTGYETASKADTLDAYVQFLATPSPGTYEKPAKDRISAILSPLREASSNTQALGAHCEVLWQMLTREIPSSNYNYSVKSKQEFLADLSAASTRHAPYVVAFGPKHVQRLGNGHSDPHPIFFLEFAGYQCVLDGFCETYRLAKPVPNKNLADALRRESVVTGFQTKDGYAPHAPIEIPPFGFQMVTPYCAGWKGWGSDVPEQYHRIDYFRGGQQRIRTVTIDHTDLAYK